MSDNTIDLYFWPTPNGKKISIMLEELEVPYRVKMIDISAGDQHKPEFLAISPNNRIPAIVDPNGPGNKPISIFESGAIMMYLADKHGKFLPSDPRTRLTTIQWLFWQMGGLGPMAGQAHHFRIFAPEHIEYAVERYTRECTRLYGIMNLQLQNNRFLAGNEYSIADMASFGWTSYMEKQGQDMSLFPNLERWFNEISNRPAVQRGMAVGSSE